MPSLRIGGDHPALADRDGNLRGRFLGPGSSSLLAPRSGGVWYLQILGIPEARVGCRRFWPGRSVSAGLWRWHRAGALTIRARIILRRCPCGGGCVRCLPLSLLGAAFIESILWGDDGHTVIPTWLWGQRWSMRRWLHRVMIAKALAAEHTPPAPMLRGVLQENATNTHRLGSPLVAWFFCAGPVCGKA